ncbi:MAG: hypothetical protein ACTSYD_09605 [Candidatus Heimdallarchaeaceae archaeon]
MGNQQESIKENLEREIQMNQKKTAPTKKSTKKKQTKKIKEEDKDKAKIKHHVYTKIEVDLWSTKLHKEEWGIRLDAQRAQKDRQWTKDMDQIGSISKDGDKYGIIAIRESLWKKEDPFTRRFVVKMFTPSSYWRGTIEQLQGESVALTLASKEPSPVFVCVLDNSKNLVRIRHVPHKQRFQGEVFTFDYVDEKGISYAFTIDDRRLTLGSDWIVKNIHGKRIANIDGKVFNVGGKYVIKIFDKELASDKTFYNVLILFSSMLRYYRSIQKNLRRIVKELRINESVALQLDESEADLYANPRKYNY